ncbi:MAG TPA: M20 family metallopeptidase [Caldilineaceae bacterium]|nr:M20 family metallopeptidase [Caldilineaceae bacterium]
MGITETIVNYLEQEDEKLAYIAKEIWDHPQIGLQETFAADLLARECEEAGFTVERGVGQMPTAFVASWGEGKPIIGVLGEYDALPGLSQELSAQKTPIERGGPGHGCGHNLFGTASFAAALAVKVAMEENNLPGTIRFYGCPAEETLVGKTFMAKDGVFDDLDAAVCWHPGDTNQIWHSSSLAMNSFKVNFYGVAAHGAAAPHLGRSALDGAQLMDVGVNYLREHVIQEARIHSVITSGGQAPNVVPAYAQIWYFVRAPQRSQVDEIYARMLDIAKGAALMSGTTYDIDFVTGCYDVLPNSVMSNLMLEKLREAGPMAFTEQEKAFAKQLQSTFPAGSLDYSFEGLKKNAAGGFAKADLDNPLWEQVIPFKPEPQVMPGSTEVGDVSYITPTGQLTTTCWPFGTPPHSWQIVASSGSSIGAKGMLHAAKAMALTAYDLMIKPDLLAAAQKEFQAATEGKAYVSPLPEDAVPH